MPRRRNIVIAANIGDPSESCSVQTKLKDYAAKEERTTVVVVHKVFFNKFFWKVFFKLKKERIFFKVFS